MAVQLDLRGITADTPYDVVYERLLHINSAAMRTAPSPEHERLHCCIDIALAYLGWPEVDD